MSLHRKASPAPRVSRGEGEAISDKREGVTPGVKPSFPAPSINRRGKKSTHKTGGVKKAPTGQTQKTPTGRRKKTPSYYIPIPLLGVVSPDALVELLFSHGQHEWTTPIRIGGLMLIIGKALQLVKKGTFCMSHELARQYVSKLGRATDDRTIREPLHLLCEIGILQRVATAITLDLKCSAKYRFNEAYRAQKRYPVLLNPKLQEKREQATDRQEKRLRRKQPFRATLLADLNRVSLAKSAHLKIEKLQESNGKLAAIRSLCNALNARKHRVTVNPRGQITTSISSTPRELKPLLRLNGKATVQCDISTCHPLLLPILLQDRIEYCAKKGYDENARRCADERLRLIEFLSEGDFYVKLLDGESRLRKKAKKEFNCALNAKTAVAIHQPTYVAFKRQFPLVCGVMEDLKAKDHRNLSKKLQSYTARIITAALLRLQQKAISAIPFVDALMVMKSDEAICCRIIGEEVFKKTGGVRAMVVGLRYSHEDTRLHNAATGQIMFQF